MDRRPIFIVGMPACGKSTFGRVLARRLGRRFVDLDSYVENRFRSSVGVIFATAGEREFRRREAAMLREVGEFEDVVVATGGGAPCHDGNMEYMNSRGLTVWLRASLPRIMARISRRPGKRPLLAGLGPDALRRRLTEMEEARGSRYAAAAIHFATDRLEDKEQIDSAVEHFLDLYLKPQADSDKKVGMTGPCCK